MLPPGMLAMAPCTAPITWLGGMFSRASFCSCSSMRTVASGRPAISTSFSWGTASSSCCSFSACSRSRRRGAWSLTRATCSTFTSLGVAPFTSMLMIPAGSSGRSAATTCSSSCRLRSTSTRYSASTRTTATPSRMVLYTRLMSSMPLMRFSSGSTTRRSMSSGPVPGYTTVTV